MKTGKQKSDSLMFVHSGVDDAGLSLKAFRVLGHLHRRAYRDDQAFPSVDGIAEAINLNRNTVKEALAELVEAGFIVREPRPGTSSIYRPVKVSEWEQAKGETRPEKQAGGWPEKQATTWPEKQASPENRPAQKPDREVARKTGHGVARKTGHKDNPLEIIHGDTPKIPDLGNPEVEIPVAKTAAEKTEKAADPRHREIMDQIGVRHKAATGQPLPIGGRDVKTLQTFLKSWKGTAEEFLATAEKAWCRAVDDHYAKNCLEGSSLSGLCTRWPQIQSELARPLSNPARQTPSRPSTNPILKACFS